MKILSGMTAVSLDSEVSNKFWKSSVSGVQIQIRTPDQTLDTDWIRPGGALRCPGVLYLCYKQIVHFLN